MAEGIGEMIVTLPNGSTLTRIRLHGILYTPSLGFTLISIGRIDEASYFAIFGNSGCLIRDHDGKAIGRIPKSGGVYMMEHVHHVKGEVANAAVKQVTLRELHESLGHIAPSTILGFIKVGLLPSVKVDGTGEDFECKACILSKSTRKSIASVRKGGRATEFAEEIHLDLWGPARVRTPSGRKYYASFTDDWSWWTTIYLLHSKSDVFAAYRSFSAWIATHFDVKIGYLHADRGGEYINEKFASLLDEDGTGYKLTVHDRPAQNGVAERLNRMLIEWVRALLLSSGLPVMLWGECLMHVAYLLNWTGMKALPMGKTPFELIYKEKADVTNLLVWGAVVWVHDASSGKLGVRAKEGRWLGCDGVSNGSRIYWKERCVVTVECNIIFLKEGLPGVDYDIPAAPHDVVDESRRREVEDVTETFIQEVQGIEEDENVDEDEVADELTNPTDIADISHEAEKAGDRVADELTNPTNIADISHEAEKAGDSAEHKVTPLPATIPEPQPANPTLPALRCMS
jgi:hypothetical protein